MAPLPRIVLFALVLAAAVLAPSAAGQSPSAADRWTALAALPSAAFDGTAPAALRDDPPRGTLTAPTGLGTARVDDGPQLRRRYSFDDGLPARTVSPLQPAATPPARAPRALHYAGPADASTDGLSLDFGRDRGLLAPVRSVEHRLRGFTEAHRRWLAPTLAGAAAVTQGWLHGTFYGFRDPDRPFDGRDVHAAAYVHASIVWSLAYVAGADPLDAYGTAVIANFFFQGLLNVGLGRPFVSGTESTCWDTWGDVCVPKPLTGGSRYAQIGVGAALILGPRLLRRLF